MVCFWSLCEIGHVFCGMLLESYCLGASGSLVEEDVKAANWRAVPGLSHPLMNAE